MNSPSSFNTTSSINQLMVVGERSGPHIEAPTHYRYLKEFRVEQCTQFTLHECQYHRPFTCFNWHFPNQRRRRPVRDRNGTFNYSPDNYCSKYDETNGSCPDGDECPLLHRTVGDTERRYHLRYFKTCMCVYETDPKGACTKNGAHCAFAHNEVDKRPPVFDIRETQQPPSDLIDELNFLNNGPNQLDKERNMMIDDPKWQGAPFVLAHYKTEPCKRPPRLCRQGYACPQYHNQRDRRRSPKLFKYRSTPCPNVKHGNEWGEPGGCEQEDDCPYTHTRTEQQFHPEIYKSSWCHDVYTSQYCPRGPFCAFAHVDLEMQINRNLPLTNVCELLSSALPSKLSTSTVAAAAAAESNNNTNSVVDWSHRPQSFASAVKYHTTPFIMPGSSLMDSLMKKGGEYSLWPIGGGVRTESSTSSKRDDDSSPINEWNTASGSGPGSSFRISIPSTPSNNYFNYSSPAPAGGGDRFRNQSGSPYQRGRLYSSASEQQHASLPSPLNGYDFKTTDLTYASYKTLLHYQTLLQHQLELVEKSLETHVEGHPNYACLSCEGKENYRSVTLVPCDHQVVCTACAAGIVTCPLCHITVTNRKFTQ